MALNTEFITAQANEQLTTILRLSGDLTIVNAVSCKFAFFQLLETQQNCEIEIAAVAKIDSSFLQLLACFFSTVKENDFSATLNIKDFHFNTLVQTAGFNLESFECT